MKGEHLSNCAPETVVSGLKKLPLSYVYKNLAADTNQPAMQKLPTNEPLQGSDTYKSLMRFFTTFNITAEKLRKKTQERLNELYPQVNFKSPVHYAVSSTTCDKLRYSYLLDHMVTQENLQRRNMFAQIIRRDCCETKLILHVTCGKFLQRFFSTWANNKRLFLENYTCYLSCLFSEAPP